jgi:two-component system NtrC family sensor kinase
MLLRGFSHVDDDAQEPMDVNQAIDKTLNMIGSELKRETKIIKVYGELPPVKGYPQKLGQVFLNVLMNAAQAVGDNGLIKITTRQLIPVTGRERAKVEICITANGHGIPSSEISKLFDLFFPPNRLVKERSSV